MEEDYKAGTGPQKDSHPETNDDKNQDECTQILFSIYENGNSYLAHCTSTLTETLISNFKALVRMTKYHSDVVKVCDVNNFAQYLIVFVTNSDIPAVLLNASIECMYELCNNEIINSKNNLFMDMKEFFVALFYSGLSSLSDNGRIEPYLGSLIKLLYYVIDIDALMDILFEIHQVFNKLSAILQKYTLDLYSCVIQSHSDSIDQFIAQCIANDTMLSIRGYASQSSASYTNIICKLYIKLLSLQSINIEIIDDSDTYFFLWVDLVIEKFNPEIIWIMLKELVCRNHMIAYSLGTSFESMCELTIHSPSESLYDYIIFLINGDVVDNTEFQSLFENITSLFPKVECLCSAFEFLLTYINKCDTLSTYGHIFNVSKESNIFSIFTDVVELYIFRKQKRDYILLLSSACIKLYQHYEMVGELTSNVEDSFIDFVNELQEYINEEHSSAISDILNIRDSIYDDDGD